MYTSRMAKKLPFFRILLNCDKVPFASFNDQKCLCLSILLSVRSIYRGISRQLLPIAEFDILGLTHSFRRPADFGATNIKKKEIYISCYSKWIIDKNLKY